MASSAPITDLVLSNLDKIIDEVPGLKTKHIPLYPLCSENAPVYSKLLDLTGNSITLNDLFDITQQHQYH
ncbi:MAG: hypothetical protein WC781_04930 [Candidatus Pacearchaeota archaeon]|jgi:hypothetical protein